MPSEANSTPPPRRVGLRLLSGGIAEDFEAVVEKEKPSDRPVPRPDQCTQFGGPVVAGLRHQQFGRLFQPCRQLVERTDVAGVDDVLGAEPEPEGVTARLAAAGIGRHVAVGQCFDRRFAVAVEFSGAEFTDDRREIPFVPSRRVGFQEHVGRGDDLRRGGVTGKLPELPVAPEPFLLADRLKNSGQPRGVVQMRVGQEEGLDLQRRKPFRIGVGSASRRLRRTRAARRRPLRESTMCNPVPASVRCRNSFRECGAAL